MQQIRALLASHALPIVTLTLTLTPTLPLQIRALLASHTLPLVALTPTLTPTLTLQIRALLASHALPIVGDVRYGGPPCESLALHAAVVRLLHPPYILHHACYGGATWLGSGSGLGLANPNPNPNPNANQVRLSHPMPAMAGLPLQLTADVPLEWGTVSSSIVVIVVVVVVVAVVSSCCCC